MVREGAVDAVREGGNATYIPRSSKGAPTADVGDVATNNHDNAPSGPC